MTLEQFNAFVTARQNIIECLGNLIGPEFDGRSGYYSDDNFIVDFSTTLEDEPIVDVYLIKVADLIEDGVVVSDRQSVKVFGTDLYRTGIWENKLVERVASVVAERATHPVAVPEPPPFAPIDDSEFFS